jgi:Skp family chaperone for outer membrane proteins
MKKKITIVVLIILNSMLILGCNQATTPSQVQVLTDSESASRISELENENKQLEAEKQQLELENQQLEINNNQLEDENRQLKAESQSFDTENQQLSSENRNLQNSLTEVRSKLESVQRELPTISGLHKDAQDFAGFLEGLPELPSPPPGFDDINKINDVVNKAVFLRELLERLPSPPPFAPAEWVELDEMKDEFIEMTEWMEDLEDLPEFLRIAGDLDDLRFQEIEHLDNIADTMERIKNILTDEVIVYEVN